MKFFVAFLFCVLLGGIQAQNAAEGDYPSHVILTINPGARTGEGVILNDLHVLTVAENCFDATDRNTRLAPANIIVTHSTVQVGPAPTGVAVARIFAHDHYNFASGKFNVAVLRLQAALTFTPNVPRPVVGAVTIHNRIVPEGTQCQVVGLQPVAATQNRQLHAALLAVFNRNDCNIVPNPDIQGSVYDQHICVGGVATTATNCGYNPGAAFYCNGELVGLRTTGLACNLINSPGVFVQARWFREWIAQQYTRTDNPPAGPVPPPGVSDEIPDGASTIILSSLALAMVAFVTFLGL